VSIDLEIDEEFHFPFSILHLSFVIAARHEVPAMTNDKCNMENGKLLHFLIS
jgi:hypothetical protein